MNEPQCVVLFGVQVFGPFDSDEHARRWMAQSDIEKHPEAFVVPLTKPEFDEPSATPAPETNPHT